MFAIASEPNNDHLQRTFKISFLPSVIKINQEISDKKMKMRFYIGFNGKYVPPFKI